MILVIMPMPVISMSKLLKKFFLIIIILLMSVQINAANISEENKLKAALLFKLTQFIEWPEGIERPEVQQFGICVLGNNDIDAALDSLTGRRVNNIAVKVQHFKNSQSVIQHCQLVFISGSKAPFLASILSSLQQYPILTISDSTGFAGKGGMIQLVNKNRHYSFIINLKKVQTSGLRIAAPLLQLSTIVESNKEAP